jgi:hypothetical protein
MRRLGLALTAAAALAACHDRVLDAYHRSAGDPTACEAIYDDPLARELDGTTRSHWLAPWRSVVQTRPAAALRDSLAATFSSFAQSPALAQRLVDAGARRGLVELQWGLADYDDPSRLANAETTRSNLAFMRRAGVRPLVLLDAIAGAPAPRKAISLTTASPARAGERTLQLDAASAALVVRGKTVFTKTGDNADPILVVAIDGSGRATLSRALSTDWTAGTHDAYVLRYAPWASPTTAPDGFEDTMRGWEAFMDVALGLAREAFPDGDFDVLLLNGDGSPFLDVARYGDSGQAGAAAEIHEAFLARAARWVREPGHGVAAAKLWDGFYAHAAGAIPRPPAGVDGALLTLAWRDVDAATAAAAAAALRPLDGGGHPEGTPTGAGWSDAFVPPDHVAFPEVFLDALTTRQIVPLLSSLPTELGTFQASFRLDLARGGGLDDADVGHALAKSLLRTVVAYVGVGLRTVGLYDSYDDPALAVVREAPGREEPAAALTRLVAAFADAGPTTTQRQIKVRSIAACDDGVQFGGDGSDAHPSLRNRDVVAVFPFQTSDRSFVLAAYVMTRDLGRVYGASGDPTRLDLPGTRYTLRLGGLDASRLTATATDPLTGANVPASVERAPSGDVLLRVPLTDSPRLVTLQER